jgi:hypothetical protein
MRIEGDHEGTKDGMSDAELGIGCRCKSGPEDCVQYQTGNNPDIIDPLTGRCPWCLEQGALEMLDEACAAFDDGESHLQWELVKLAVDSIKHHGLGNMMAEELRVRARARR